MMKRNIFLFWAILFICGSPNAVAQVATRAVFRNGAEGYSCYRIPAIVKSPDGRLLAFAEARKKDCDDFGDIDIVMKSSVNNGKDWSPLQLVVDRSAQKAGNPAPVMDLLDERFPGGRLFLLYNTATGSESDSRKGLSVREVWYITSTDNGTTWSEPQNITTSVHKPLAQWYNEHYNFKEDWRTNALTPGHAFQFKSGDKSGRIFVAANHSVGNRKDNKDFDNYRAHCFYSDDHGDSWQLGADIPVPGGNESTAAELSDGGVLQNIRYQNKAVGRRMLAFSKAGGGEWDTVYISEHLPDPVCQGSMININFKKKHLLLFSNAASEKVRERMTIRASVDDGKSWFASFLVDPGPSAYSDLVQVKAGIIGILYEKGNEGGIVYAGIPLKKILK